MRLTTVILIASLMQISAATLAQKISMNTNNASLKTVIQTLRKQSGYDFIYNDKTLKQASPVTISVKDAEFQDVLTEIFKNQNLSYSVDSKTVVIKEKETPSFLSRLAAAFSNITIHGTVVDSLGNPLPGAAIKIKNTSKSTSTDGEGKFFLNDVPEDAIIQISYIGYITKEVKASKEIGRITLSQANNRLDEVKVQYSTGYQTLHKERATGSFDFIGKDKLDTRVSTDIISKLDGLGSGLVFNKGATTGKRELSIRSRGTIFGNAQPLIVVDNFPYDGDINNINPDDVESITLLKDAAAASIWGAKSGNGVIVIVTKKGRKNQPLNVSLNANFTTSAKPDLNYNQNFLPSSDYIGIQQELYNRGVYTTLLADPNKIYAPVPAAVKIMGSNQTPAQKGAALDALKQIDVRDDLKKYFYQPAANQQYHLSLTGGSDKSTYAVSVGYNNNRDNQVGNSFGRWTINSNLNFFPLKNLEVGGIININQSVTKTNNSLNEFLNGNGAYYPYTSLADADGNALVVQKDYDSNFINNVIPGKGFLDWTYRPLDELRNGYSTSQTILNDYRLAPTLKYTFIKGLSAQLNYQFERSVSNAQSLNNRNGYFLRNLRNQFSDVVNGIPTNLKNVPEGDLSNTADMTLRSTAGRFLLNYDNNWGKNTLSIIAGAEVREAISDIALNTQYGYNKDNGQVLFVDVTKPYYNLYPSGAGFIPNNMAIRQLVDRYRSYFFNGSYTYDQKYTISSSARNDASNLFGVNTNQKRVPLWSVGAKWDISKENFYPFEWLPTLKLRATYGYTGNVNRDISAYTITTRVTGTGYLGVMYPYQLITSAGNPELRWEKTATTNLAIDFETKSSRISGTFEYFRKTGKDLIGDSPISVSTGFAQLRGNFSDMKGSGIDIKLDVKNTTGGIKWTTGYLLSHAVDQIIRYDGESPNPDALGGFPLVTGFPVQGIFSHPWAGLDPKSGDPRGYLNGQVSTDYDKMRDFVAGKELTENWIFRGSAVPTWWGAFRNTISYRNFSLSANISFKAGYYFWKRSVSYSNLYSGTNIGNIDYIRRWQRPGDEENTYVPSFPLTNNPSRDGFYYNSDVLVQKGDHIRLQDIYFSYDLDKKIIGSFPVRSIRFYAYLNNIGILWRANNEGIDPDFSTYTQNINPNPRTYSFGVQASF